MNFRVSVDCREPLVHFLVVELGETVQGSAMICLELLGQLAEELRLPVVSGSQAFPPAPCGLCAQDFSIPAASYILVIRECWGLSPGFGEGALSCFHQ